MHAVTASSRVADAHTLSLALSMAPPLGELVVWSEQQGDMSWVDSLPHLLTLAKTSDRILAAVARRSFGEMPTRVFWVSRAQRRIADLEAAFGKTRWAYVGSYGASTAVDSRMQPPLYFLTEGVLQDEMDQAGRGGVDLIARRLGAVAALVHSIRPTTWRPGVTFTEALRRSAEERAEHQLARDIASLRR